MVRGEGSTGAAAAGLPESPEPGLHQDRAGTTGLGPLVPPADSTRHTPIPTMPTSPHSEAVRATTGTGPSERTEEEAVMSPTESRTGFRLPWSTDHREETEEQPATDAQTAADVDASTDAPADPVSDSAAAQAWGTTEQSEAGDVAGDDRPPHDDARATTDAQTDTEVPQVFPAADAPAAPASTIEPTTAHPTEPQRGHRPEKFLADLTRAMQAAAEAARDQSLSQFAADSKQYVDEIQARSAEEAAALREGSEADIAATREWSKAEMARIREETEARVSQRRSQLEQELQAHGELVEQRVDRVNRRLEAYRSEMADFFEQLLAVDDPTRFARLAEEMPEPPSLDDAWVDYSPKPTAPERAVLEPAAIADTPVESSLDADPGTESTGETVQDTTQPDEQARDVVASADSPGWPANDRAVDFGAAEAEAEAAASALDDGSDETDGSDEPGDDMSQAAVDARLAGLVLTTDEEDTEQPTSGSTSLVVSGLVSVASIAAFKRQVARVPGVTAVTVSSGPDGEFVFVATHGEGAQLAGEVAGFSGFEAQVTEASNGVLRISARDPEA